MRVKLKYCLLILFFKNLYALGQSKSENQILIREYSIDSLKKDIAYLQLKDTLNNSTTYYSTKDTGEKGFVLHSSSPDTNGVITYYFENGSIGTEFKVDTNGTLIGIYNYISGDIYHYYINFYNSDAIKSIEYQNLDSSLCDYEMVPVKHDTFKFNKVYYEDKSLEPLIINSKVIDKNGTEYIYNREGKLIRRKRFYRDKENEY